MENKKFSLKTIESVKDINYEIYCFELMMNYPEKYEEYKKYLDKLKLGQLSSYFAYLKKYTISRYFGELCHFDSYYFEKKEEESVSELSKRVEICDKTLCYKESISYYPEAKKVYEAIVKRAKDGSFDRATRASLESMGENDSTYIARVFDNDSNILDRSKYVCLMELKKVDGIVVVRKYAYIGIKNNVNLVSVNSVIGKYSGGWVADPILLKDDEKELFNKLPIVSSNDYEWFEQLFEPIAEKKLKESEK